MAKRWTNDLRTAAIFVQSIETDDREVNLELLELAERIRMIAERLTLRSAYLRETPGPGLLDPKTGT